MDDVIKLIRETYSKNIYGVDTPGEPDYFECFCQIHSVMRQEFFDAGRNGLNPAFMITMFHGDYNGESLLEYEGKIYSIYRTFIVPGTDYIELYVERQGGSNGKESHD